MNQSMVYDIHPYSCALIPAAPGIQQGGSFMDIPGLKGTMCGLESKNPLRRYTCESVTTIVYQLYYYPTRLECREENVG
mgnify:CR=1 FL=1